MLVLLQNTPLVQLRKVVQMVFVFSCEACSNFFLHFSNIFSRANLLKQLGLFENNKIVSFDIYSLT